ncbi:hypothetical protein Kpol_1024p7 [Vanderwaltozyma polyspora DSM 70294]|uniref:Pre-rRNA-processing protein RIX1 n=1 Tax=Vanderwaltozyma polyspora (strain ATCC 22028 / DSM 70294 / BCRC 21397 / CBS 2163 / NBRC 10782 / NRRL Y-8283 / UCD 57-17) TaxID=436907 RepID=A7TLG8_VANPO|nr:uncharacterized protein Kpol_1024p7 [Vanderwaltozyma polyspora DSM 70294]EDO16854.1 hypothetical protein Kpol_1024p7 [Vanderwaltozyma polyspora DSM 70294]
MSEFRSEVPVSVLAKKLELANGDELQTILRTLRSPTYVNEKLLKSELGLLVTKILKLLRSSDDYEIWKGCHTAAIICAYNPLVLCSHGSQLLATIYSKLEQRTSYYSSTSTTVQGRVVIETLISTLSILMDLMRTKPTMSREGLIPKLKTIIPTLITLTQYQPKLCLPVLKVILLNHHTTFKPFSNKYRTVLLELLSKEYQHMDKETRLLVCDNYAYLHLIKLQSDSNKDNDATQAHHKAFQDEAWRAGLLDILNHFKPILKLVGEILDLDQDKELVKLMNSLPGDIDVDKKANELLKLPSLKLDMNSPITLWDINNRLNILVDLLSSFISLPTPYPVRIPLGSINAVAETLLSLTQNYLPIKRDLRRDAELTSVITSMLPHIQFTGIKLWNKTLSNYGKSCLTFLPSILGSLELFIPMRPKSNEIDFEKCQTLKREFLFLFKLINRLTPELGHQLSELSLFTKLINISLYLVEDRSLLLPLFNPEKKLKTENNNKGVKKSKTRDNQSGALSDLYTHSNQFIIRDSLKLLSEVANFLCTVLSNWRLPSAQQVKIVKFAITSSIKYKEEYNKIPENFVKLLRMITIYPGNERISILPIAATLLKDSGDDVLDVLCHPRVPMGIVHQITRPFKESDIEDNEISQLEESRSKILDFETVGETKVDKQDDFKKLQLENSKRTFTEREVDETKLFKKDEDVEIKKAKISNSEEIVSKSVNQKESIAATATPLPTENYPLPDTKEVITIEANHDNDESSDDSEFEIPEIQLSDDEE